MTKKIIKKILTEKSYLTGKYCLSPEFLSLLITFRCNCRCPSCSVWKITDHDELPDEEWLKMVPKLAFLSPGTYVEINGGEPLIRKELVLKLTAALKKHFKTVAINSNGLLIDEKTVSELEKAGLDIMKISFYSPEKDIHNSLRGNPQAYESALKALRLLSRSKIRTEAGILIASKNIRELPGLIEFLKRSKNISVILQPLDESIESPASKNMGVNDLLTDLWPNKEDTTAFFDWASKNHRLIKNPLANIKAIKKYYLNPHDILNYRCFAGQKNLVIYPDGGTSLCFKGKTVGDLKETGLNEILKGEKALKERKRIKNCRKYCRIVGCNFSRGFAEFIRDKI